MPGKLCQLWTESFERPGAPYLQADMVGLVGLQGNDVFTRNVGPFFLTTFVFFFIFPVKGIEPANRFSLTFVPFGFGTLGEIENPDVLR